MAIRRLVPAMEMIEFQNDDKFPVTVEALITGIYSNIKNNRHTEKEIQTSPELEKIEELTFNRLGLRVAIDTVQGHGGLAAILPFYPNRNHIFIPKQWHGQVDIEDQTKLLAKLNGERGTVDLKNAKLGGIFSKYTNPVYLSFHKLIEDYQQTPSELTAIYLHEVGHGFSSCEYSDRVATCNQVLTNVAKELSKPEGSRKAEYVYKELMQINPNTTHELAEDMVKGERVVLGNRAFKYIIDSVLFQMDNSKYDETSFENLADSFAARFGYGRQLVSALQKFQEQSDENSDRFLAHWLQVLGMIASFLIFAAAFMVGNVFLMVYMALMSYGMTSLVFGTAGEYGRDYTYDDIKIRYKRLRDQLVQRIKTGTVPQDQALILVNDIEYLDQLVKDTSQYRSTLDTVMNVVRPANYRAKSSIERQQMLETLANNPLFVQSVKLRSLV